MNLYTWDIEMRDDFTGYSFSSIGIDAQQSYARYGEEYVEQIYS
jgi:hypothetical protein